MNRLEEMLKAGAVLVTTAGPRHVLAAATFLPNLPTFWFFEVFGEDQTSEHHLDFARMEDDGYYLNFYDEAGAILATLSPIEDDEDREIWDRWQTFLGSPEGRRAEESIAWLRDRAVNWSK